METVAAALQSRPYSDAMIGTKGAGGGLLPEFADGALGADA